MTKQREAREQVLELIETLEVGEAIPSERVLSQALGRISRLTLRAALDELVREGRLTRRRGSGTFVAEPKVAKGMTITSFSDDMRQRGLTPGSRTLEFNTISAGARLGRILHVSPSEPVLSIKRLRLADGEPRRRRAPPRPRVAVPGPDRPRSCSRRGSFYDLLDTTYRIEIVGGTQTVEPTVTSDEESKTLGVPLHSPALLFERVTRSAGGDIVDFTGPRSTAATATASSPSWGWVDGRRSRLRSSRAAASRDSGTYHSW